MGYFSAVGKVNNFICIKFDNDKYTVLGQFQYNDNTKWTENYTLTHLDKGILEINLKKALTP